MLGTLCPFCSYHWKTGDNIATLESRFPRLFSYVKDPWMSTKEVFNVHQLMDLFHLPLCEQAYKDFWTCKIWQGPMEEMQISMILGGGRVLPNNSSPSVSIWACNSTLLLILCSLRFGGPVAPWKSRSFHGCWLCIGWTPKIWLKGGIGTWRMVFSVFSAHWVNKKQGILISLSVTSVLESGITCRLTIHRGILW